MGGWMVVGSFHSWSPHPPLVFGHTSLPLASSGAKVIAWLGHCQDQIRQQACKSSRLPVCAGLFSNDVMSHLIHTKVVQRRGEGRRAVIGDCVGVDFRPRGLRYDGQNNSGTRKVHLFNTGLRHE